MNIGHITSTGKGYEGELKTLTEPRWLFVTTILPTKLEDCSLVARWRMPTTGDDEPRQPAGVE